METQCTQVVAVTAATKLVRLVPPSSTVMATVTTLLQHAEAAGLTVLEVTTEPASALVAAPALPLYFSNICGKIEHYDVYKVLRDAVAPYVVAQNDSFGQALSIFSRQCSLRVSKAMTNTLFRGGNSSAEIAEVIEHALLPETIRRTTVHMIVASARLGRPVLMQEDLFVRKLQAVPHWHCQQNVTDEEKQKYHSIQLTRFSSAWLAQQGISEDFKPQSCLLNVCRTGAVNLSFSVSAGVPFSVGIEQLYVPMLEGIVSRVGKFT